MSNAQLHEFQRLLQEASTAMRAGRHDAARRAADRMKRVAASLTPIHRSQALVTSAALERERGRLAEAIEEYERAVDELARLRLSDLPAEHQAGVRMMKAAASCLLGAAQYRNGAPEEGRRNYAFAIREAEGVASEHPSDAYEHLGKAVEWRLELIDRENDAA